MSAHTTPLLDRILDDLAHDIELERLLRSHALMAIEDAHDQVAESFSVLCEEVLPYCSGDDWKVLSYIWGKTWLAGCAGSFVPLVPALMASATGVELPALWGTLDFLKKRGVLDLHLSDSPDGAMAYRLRIPGLEVV